MVDANMLLTYNQIAAAVYYIDDDTVLPRAAKSLRKFRTIAMGEIEKTSFKVNNKDQEFNGIIVAIKSGMAASARAKALVKAKGNYDILRRRGRIMALKLGFSLMETIDCADYEGKDWKDDEDLLDETVVEDPVPEADESTIDEGTTGVVTLKRFNRYKHKLEEVMEANEALADEVASLQKMKEDVMAAVATMIGTKISEAVPTMINEAFRLDQKPIIDQCKASIDQLLATSNAQPSQIRFTTQGLPEDSIEKLTEKYLAAGISSWRDAAGKYLTDMFSQETLANSCPTEEGAKQSLDKKGNKKPPLDPVRIKILRDFVNYFVSKNTAKKEEIPGKGRVTSRIHCATKQAREKLELLESQQ